MTGGWFAMSRATFEHPIFKGRADRVGVWAWIIASAAWKETRQNVNGKEVIVARGQLSTSYRLISDATGVSIKAVRSLLDRLSTGNAVGIDTGTGRLLITLRNYDEYQAAGEGGGKAGAREGHTKEQGNKGTREQCSDPNGSGDFAEEPTLDLNLPPDPPPEPVDAVKTAIWARGVPFLVEKKVDEKKARQMIGKWLSKHGSQKLFDALVDASKAQTGDPIPYITATLEGTGRTPRERAGERQKAVRIAEENADVARQIERARQRGHIG